jgi:hypothetical protein
VKLYVTPIYHVFRNVQDVIAEISSSKLAVVLLELMNLVRPDLKSKLSATLAQLASESKVREQISTSGLEELVSEVLCYKYVATDNLKTFLVGRETSAESAGVIPTGTEFLVDKRLFKPSGKSGDGHYQLRIKDLNVYVSSVRDDKVVVAQLRDHDSMLFELLGRLINGSDASTSQLLRRGRVGLLMKIANTGDILCQRAVADALRKIAAGPRINWSKQCALYKIVPVVTELTLLTETSYKVEFSLSHTLETVDPANAPINFVSIESRPVLPGAKVVVGPKWKLVDDECHIGTVEEITAKDEVVVQWESKQSAHYYRPRKEEVQVVKDANGNLISYKHDAMIKIIFQSAASLKLHKEFSLRIFNHEAEKTLTYEDFATCGDDYVCDEMSAKKLVIQLSYNPHNKELTDALKSIRIYITNSYDPSSVESDDLSLEEDAMCFLLRIVASDNCALDTRLAALGALKNLCKYDEPSATVGATKSYVRSPYLDRLIMDTSGVFRKILSLLAHSNLALNSAAWEFMDSLITDTAQLLDMCTAYPELMSDEQFILFASYAMFKLTHRKFCPMLETYLEGSKELRRSCRLNSFTFGTLNVDPTTRNTVSFPAGTYLLNDDNLKVTHVAFDLATSLSYALHRESFLKPDLHQFGVYTDSDCLVKDYLLERMVRQCQLAFSVLYMLSIQC